MDAKNAKDLETGTDVLLDEVRTRYAAEHDRYGQLFNRIGVYLAVLAIYASALLRFFEKPPSDGGGWPNIGFSVGMGLLAVLTVAAFVMLLLALWGTGVDYSPRPSEWRAAADAYWKFVEESFDYEGVPKADENAVEKRLAPELKRALIKSIGEATDGNIQRNARRFVCLHWTSRLAALAFAPLALAVACYGWMTWRGPEAVTQVKIVEPVLLGADGPLREMRVVDPVVVQLDTSGTEVCVSDKKPPVRPEPPRPEFIKEGEVPRPRSVPPPPPRPAPKPK